MSSFTKASEGFQITAHGSGTPSRLLTGGLAYSPGDYQALVRELPGTSVIVDNPMHTGKMPWDSNRLRAAYAELAEAHECTELVTHSLGSLDAIAVARQLNMPPEGIVFLSPPLCARYRERIKNACRLPDGVTEQFGILDPVLSDLCADMTEDEYVAFLREHFTLYGGRTKANYKKGMPNAEVIPDLITQMVGDINGMTRTRVLALVCTDDMWAPPPGEELPAFAPHVTVQRIQGAHYPHRVRPQAVAAMISAWESGENA